MTSHISSVMGFLTTSLHKNCQNDVKLLETFWPILGKVERAEITCDVIKKSCSTFFIKFWLYIHIFFLFKIYKDIKERQENRRRQQTNSAAASTSLARRKMEDNLGKEHSPNFFSIILKYRRFEKIVWIQSHHLHHLQWKFKLLAWKFT